MRVTFSLQTYTQNVSISPDYFTWRSAVPSLNESSHDQHEDDMVNTQERMGKL